MCATVPRSRVGGIMEKPWPKSHARAGSRSDSISVSDGSEEEEEEDGRDDDEEEGDAMGDGPRGARSRV